MRSTTIFIDCYDNGRMKVEVKNLEGIRKIPDNRGFRQYTVIKNIVDYLNAVYRDKERFANVRITLNKDCKFEINKEKFFLRINGLDYVNDPITRNLIDIISGINKKINN